MKITAFLASISAALAVSHAQTTAEAHEQAGDFKGW